MKPSLFAQRMLAVAFALAVIYAAAEILFPSGWNAAFLSMLSTIKGQEIASGELAVVAVSDLAVVLVVLLGAGIVAVVQVAGWLLRGNERFSWWKDLAQLAAVAAVVALTFLLSSTVISHMVDHGSPAVEVETEGTAGVLNGPNPA